MAPSRGPSALTSLWYRWKTLKLPWRKQFLIGSDLAGNTFWEFKDALNTDRFRRIVRYPRNTHHGDVKISPQWHQWLRHTRSGAPSIQEQQYEVSRQESMKQLATEADERWKSKPSFLDSPNRQQPDAPTAITDSKPIPEAADSKSGADMQSAVGDHEDVAKASGAGGRERGRKDDKDPPSWATQQKVAPGEKWEPASWTPGATRRR